MARIHVFLLLLGFLHEQATPIIIKPFQALRPAGPYAQQMTCPDSGTIDDQQAKNIAKTNPISFVHIARPEVDCPPITQLYDAVAGLKSFKNLTAFIKQRLLIQDNKPCLYLYGRQADGNLQVGIISLVAVDHYGENNIKRHEQVIKQKKQKLVRYTELQRAQVDPVLLMYPRHEQISNIITNVITAHNPTQSVSEGDIIHHIWLIEDERDIAALADHFATISTLYIADGHHRSAAAHSLLKRKHKNNLTLPCYDYYMAGIFSFDQVSIKSYNRIIKDLDDKSPNDIMQELRNNFNLRMVNNAREALPTTPRSFGIYIDGQWIFATLKNNFLAEVDAEQLLDVEIFGKLFLQPTLKIDINRPDVRVEFIGGAQSIETVEKKCNNHGWPMAIMFFPVQSESFSAVVDAGRLMPPKTTWIEPKVKIGLFTYPYFTITSEKDEP